MKEEIKVLWKKELGHKPDLDEEGVIEKIIEIATTTERERIVDIIKNFKFYDWSGEQEIYDQVEEIIKRFNQK